MCVCIGKNGDLDSQVKHNIIIQMALGHGKNISGLGVPLKNSQTINYGKT